jgi:hypothetical protein
MAVIDTDLLQPNGFLDEKYFPGMTSSAVLAMLDGYITQAEARVTTYNVPSASADRYVTAWSYYRAYTRVAERLLATPRDAKIEDEGSRSYEQKQADGFFRIAANWLAEAEQLVPAEETAIVGRTSVAVRNRYEW